MDLWSDVTRRQPWSFAASSWPARPESDVGTGPGACSHTACRTSWCRRYCSPDMRERGEVSINAQAASNIWTWYTRSHPVYFLLSIGGARWIDLYGHRRSEDHYMVHMYDTRLKKAFEEIITDACWPTRSPDVKWTTDTWEHAVWMTMRLLDCFFSVPEYNKSQVKDFTDTYRPSICLCFMLHTPSPYTALSCPLEEHANICAPDINRLINRITWSHICSVAKTDRNNSIIGPSYRSNTDTHTAQAAVGAQNKKLLPVGTEGVSGHKALLKQPDGR